MNWGKKILLTVRALVEATFGLICMSSLLLLPATWRKTFPQIFLLGFLGMPRSYHNGPVNFQKLNDAMMLAGFLGVTILFLSALLYFKDVLEIIRKLASRSDTF